MKRRPIVQIPLLCRHVTQKKKKKKKRKKKKKEEEEEEEATTFMVLTLSSWHIRVVNPFMVGFTRLVGLMYNLTLNGQSIIASHLLVARMSPIFSDT
jgi:hypothetical protein